MKIATDQSIEIPCLKVIQPLGEFYIGVMNCEDLVKVSYVDIRRLVTGTEEREVEIYTGIQRPLSGGRVKEISKYVNLVDATFPTSVILHIDQENARYDEATGNLIIPFRDDVAKVLDGQHRIAGLENYNLLGNSFQVNVTIFVGMEIEDQAIVFATINKTQTKVNKSLVADLFSFAKNRSPQKTAHVIVRALNQELGSPFYGKIKILGTAVDKDKETITQATFSESIVKMISGDPMTDRDLYRRGKKPQIVSQNELIIRPFRELFIKEEDLKIAKIIWNFFEAVGKKWPEAWNQVKPEMILNKSTGFIALMKLLKEIYNSLKSFNEIPESGQFLDILDKTRLSDNDFNRNNYIPGTGGQSKLFNDLLHSIQLQSNK